MNKLFVGAAFVAAIAAPVAAQQSVVTGQPSVFTMTPNLALVGNFGYSRTNWEFEFTGPVERFAGDVGVWLYDGNLQLKFPFAAGAGTFSPFAQAGVGAIRFTADQDDFADADGATNVAFNAGLGADFNVGALGLRFMVKDYISAFKWDEFRNANDPNDLSDAETSHNFAFTLGLKLGF
jgi:hypothetical protein